MFGNTPIYNAQEEEQGHLVLASCFEWLEKDISMYIDNIQLVIILKLI